MDGTDRLKQRTIRDFGDQWTRYRDNEGLAMTELELRELATSTHFASIAV